MWFWVVKICLCDLRVGVFFVMSLFLKIMMNFESISGKLLIEELKILEWWIVDYWWIELLIIYVLISRSYWARNNTTEKEMNWKRKEEFVVGVPWHGGGCPIWWGGHPTQKQTRDQWPCFWGGCPITDRGRAPWPKGRGPLSCIPLIPW